MAFIRCPGCREVFDVQELKDVVCQGCNRCLVCGERSDGEERPACSHRLDSDTLDKICASLRCADHRVEHCRRAALIVKREYTVAGHLVFAIVGGPIAGALALLARSGVERSLGKTAGWLAFFAVLTIVLVFLFGGVPCLLARGWFPWMVKDE